MPLAKKMIIIHVPSAKNKRFSYFTCSWKKAKYRWSPFPVVYALGYVKVEPAFAHISYSNS
jgi:hypothetical protein